MKMIVLDLEMSQPSHKIIEIGAVLTNIKTGLIIDIYQTYVNPNEAIDPFITALTGIDDDTVELAPDLASVAPYFWNWCKSCNCGMQIAAWGTDIWELKSQANQVGVPAPKLRSLNLKEMSKIFRSAKGGIKLSAGLRNTLQAYDLIFEGEQHRALIDAQNTAKLLHKFYSIVNEHESITKIMKG